MCRNQMVRDIGQHQSFSLLGLALIIALGGVIIVLGMVTDTLVGWLQIGRKTEYRRRQWILEENLQLQRAAYEGIGVGNWEKGLTVIPTTTGVSMPLPPSSDVLFTGNARESVVGSSTVATEKD
jgi:hypothetical protein